MCEKDLCACPTCIFSCDFDFFFLFCPVSVLTLDLWVPFFACIYLPAPVSSPNSCPQRPKQPVMAVLLDKCPTSLSFAQRSGEAGAPLTGRQVGDPRVPEGREQQGLGGPPWAGETRWLVGQHPPVSCRLGRRGRVTPGPPGPSVPPQGGSQPSGRQQLHPHSLAPHTDGLTPSVVTPHRLPVLVWSYFDAMKTLCLYIMFIYFKDLCQESIFNKN